VSGGRTAGILVLSLLVGACGGASKADGTESSKRTTTSTRTKRTTTTSTTTTTLASTATTTTTTAGASGGAPQSSGSATSATGAPPCAATLLSGFGLVAGATFSESPDESDVTVDRIVATASGQGICLVNGVFVDGSGSAFGQYVIVDEEDAYVALVEPTATFELTPRIVSCHGPTPDVAAALVNTVTGRSYPPQSCT